MGSAWLNAACVELTAGMKLFLVEKEPGAKIGGVHRIVGVHLGVMFALKVRAEDGYVADGNGYSGTVRPG